MKRDKISEQQRFWMLINFISGLLDFHFLFMLLKSSGLKSVAYLLLGNELNIANMKTLHICEFLYDKFESQGIFIGVLISSQE
jgi:hypothetical protein